MPDWPLPAAMKEELLLVGGGLAILDGSYEAERPVAVNAAPKPPARRRILARSRPAAPVQTNPIRRAWLSREDDPRRLDRYKALAERLLIGDRAGDLQEISQREPVKSLLSAATARMVHLGIDPMQSDIEAHYQWIETVSGRAIATVEELAAMGAQAPPFAAEALAAVPPSRSWSERIDAVLIHKFWGLLIFGAIMASLFVTIFWLAAPIMGGINAIVGMAGEWTAANLPDGPVKALVQDGIFAGVGAVVVFIPQIALLFLFLAILEDSGYLARAAFLMDRVLAKVGLHGKSFIPLLSSFACAIPGIMATRTIENRKDRLATILVAPFMSCSARLPVYTLLIGTFFAAWGPLAQGGIMLALYALGIVAAAGVAWIFRRTLLRGSASAFILEMPTYKLPQVSQVGRQVWFNTSKFITKAGTTIFCLSVLLWAMVYYPRLPAERVARLGGDDVAIAAAQMEYSVAGRLGRAMEPVIRPLGYNWKMGVGLVGAFAAREVFVSTMGIIYSAGDVEQGTTSLEAAMRADAYADGQAVWTTPVAASLLVWFVLAMQCASTLAIVRRETAGWRWPIFMLLYMNALAYMVSLVVYQVGRLVIA